MKFGCIILVLFLFNANLQAQPFSKWTDTALVLKVLANPWKLCGMAFSV